MPRTSPGYPAAEIARYENANTRHRPLLPTGVHRFGPLSVQCAPYGSRSIPAASDAHSAPRPAPPSQPPSPKLRRTSSSSQIATVSLLPCYGIPIRRIGDASGRFRSGDFLSAHLSIRTSTRSSAAHGPSQTRPQSSRRAPQLLRGPFSARRLPYCRGCPRGLVLPATRATSPHHALGAARTRAHPRHRHSPGLRAHPGRQPRDTCHSTLRHLRGCLRSRRSPLCSSFRRAVLRFVPRLTRTRRPKKSANPAPRGPLLHLHRPPRFAQPDLSANQVWRTRLPQHARLRPHAVRSPDLADFSPPRQRRRASSRPRHQTPQHLAGTVEALIASPLQSPLDPNPQG